MTKAGAVRGNEQGGLALATPVCRLTCEPGRVPLSLPRLNNELPQYGPDLTRIGIYRSSAALSLEASREQDCLARAEHGRDDCCGPRKRPLRGKPDQSVQLREKPADRYRSRVEVAPLVWNARQFRWRRTEEADIERAIRWKKLQHFVDVLWPFARVRTADLAYDQTDGWEPGVRGPFKTFGVRKSHGRELGRRAPTRRGEFLLQPIHQGVIRRLVGHDRPPQALR